MRDGLKTYVEAEIIPRYRTFDKAHQEDHARSVIAQALELARYYDVDPDLVYTAAAYHDTASRGPRVEIHARDLLGPDGQRRKDGQDGCDNFLFHLRCKISKFRAKPLYL